MQLEAITQAAYHWICNRSIKACNTACKIIDKSKLNNLNKNSSKTLYSIEKCFIYVSMFHISCRLVKNIRVSAVLFAAN